MCSESKETTTHLFSECRVSADLWSARQNHVQNNMYLPHLSDENVHLGFISNNSSMRSENHILLAFKDVRVHAPITCIKLRIPIYFMDHSEFITVQCKKILSRANNEIKCFEFSSIKRALRPHLRQL